MTKEPHVDILIITYNQEKYVDEAIKSIINQTYSNCKVVIADDCSTDNTRNIIDKWFNLYPDRIIKIYNKTNLGITGNSNAALEHCHGDYLVAMGGDDVLYPNKIEEQLNWFKKHPDMSLCGHNLDLIDESSLKFGIYSSLSKNGGKGNSRWIKFGMLYGCMSIMIKRDKKQNLFFDERLIYSSDLKFFIDFLGREKAYGYLESCLGAYRKSETSITATKWEACVNDTEKMFGILRQSSNGYLKRDIKKGENYSINYGRALKNYHKREYFLSVKEFAGVIVKDFTLWKAYPRIIQATIGLLLKRR